MNPVAEPALSIVRRYTDQRQEEGRNDTLTQALATKVEFDRQDEIYGRKLFKDSALDVLRDSKGQEPGDDFLGQISELKGVSDELQTDWNEAIKVLNKKGKHNIPSKPDMTTLSRLFQDAQEELQAKRISKSGKIKTWLIDAAESIDKHKFLLNMLPDGDKYTSVLVGSFTALIQVAVTYSKTTKVIADSFDQISDQVHHLRRALRQNQENIHIKEQVGKFYCHFFRFLIQILQKWLLSAHKRFFTSFGGDLVEELSDAIQRMERCSKNVEREVQLEQQRSSDEVCATLKRLENLRNLGRRGTATLFSIAVNYHFDPSGSSLVQTLAESLPAQPSSPSADLETSASSVAETEDSATLENLSSKPIQAGLATVPTDEEIGGKAPLDEEDDTLDHIFTKAMIKGAVAHFEPFFQDAYIQNLAPQAQYLPVSTEMRADILEMASSHHSAALWVQGLEESEAPSRSTLTAAHMFHGLRQLGIATVGYFISLNPAGKMDGKRELLGMVCALAYQISLVLSDNIRFTIDLDAKMASLRTLPESDADVSRSLAPAIGLLEALLEISPPLLFCIVDGYSLLESYLTSPAARSASKRFVSCICEAATRKQTTARTQIFKALFTTEEYCEELQDAVNRETLSCVIHNEEDNDDTMDFESDDVLDLAEE